MNRISLIAVLCAASHVLGADPKADLIQGTASAFRWELGAVGKFEEGDYFRVVKVIAVNALIVEGRRTIPATATSPARVVTIHNPFLVAGLATGGVVDDATIKLVKTYKVTNTNEQYGKKMFVIQEEVEILPMPRIQAKIVKGPPAKPIDPEAAAQAMYDKVASRDGLREIIEKYPDTAAAKKCRERIAKLDKK